MLGNLTGMPSGHDLAIELETLRDRERAMTGYVRDKVNELLMVMGTLPLRTEELDDQTLLELDPIGTIANSFANILNHLNETNEKLKTARDEIQAILTSVGSGILVVDDHMRIKAYNPKFRELFMKNGDHVIGQPCNRILCDLDTPPEDCTFKRIFAANIGLHRPNWVYRDRHYDVSGAPIKDRYGKITHVVLVYHDITDRKRIEESLQEREEMYRNLFDNSLDLVQSVNDEGGLTYVNHSWLETLGYEADDIFSLTLADIIHPDHLPECQAFFRELQGGKKGGKINTVFRGKDGTAHLVSGDVSCCFSDGELITTCGIFRRMPAAT
jgi:two-component system phosphate regulon sensor histidine kinase PhoR